MHHLSPVFMTTDHPDAALFHGLEMLVRHGVKEESRNGSVLRMPNPFTTGWLPGFNPVSVDPNRDANPFLHFIEAMWMMAGRNDVQTVATLAPNMMNYSDDGQTLHGAYGHRWRSWFGCDQIAVVIDELRKNPTSRRCVIQMWDGSVDLHRGVANGKDIPCNTAIYFDPQGGDLNMTVTNRSNDTIWGAYGANVVHMSMLHSYIAHQVGMKTGTYFQMSNNLHIYIDFPVTQKVLDVRTGEVKIKRVSDSEVEAPLMGNLFADVTCSDAEFVHTISRVLDAFLRPGPDDLVAIETQFKSVNLLITLCTAFNIYKAVNANDAVKYLDHFTWEGAPSTEHCTNWIAASIAWLKRRPSFEKEAQ